eukprot:3426736-Prymnesium_polylepis.1
MASIGESGLGREKPCARPAASSRPTPREEHDDEVDLTLRVCLCHVVETGAHPRRIRIPTHPQAEFIHWALTNFIAHTNPHASEDAVPCGMAAVRASAAGTTIALSFDGSLGQMA